MYSQQVKKQQIADLLLANVAPKKITITIRVSITTYHNVKNSISNGEEKLRSKEVCGGYFPYTLISIISINYT